MNPLPSAAPLATQRARFTSASVVPVEGSLAIAVRGHLPFMTKCSCPQPSSLDALPPQRRVGAASLTPRDGGPRAVPTMPEFPARRPPRSACAPSD